MELYYATTNPGKVQSLQRDLERYGIKVVQVPMELPESRSSDVQEIAEGKVVFAYNQLKKSVVALDAGFYIPSLNGFPGALADFALKTIGLEGILKLVEDKDRNCEFRECLAYLDDSLTEPKCFIAHVKGTLSYEPKGNMQKHHWSKLALIFIPEGSGKTLAEMSYERYLEWRRISREKESPSRLFSEWFNAHIKNQK